MEESSKKNKRLIKNVIFNLITQAANLVIPLILTPYLARVLHEEGNGQYSYCFSIITFFVIFANLGFDIYGQRQVAKCQNDKYQVSKVFWEIFIVKFVFIISRITQYFIPLFSNIF